MTDKPPSPASPNRGIGSWWRRIWMPHPCVICGERTAPTDTYLRVGDGTDPVHIYCKRDVLTGGSEPTPRSSTPDSAP